MARSVGSLFVNLVAKTDKFEKGMKRAQKTTKTFKGSLMSTGKQLLAFGGISAAVAVGGMAAFIRSQLVSLDLLGKQSAALGITTEALSALQYTASIMGVESKGLSVALKKMEKSIYDAGAGLTTAVRGFKALGLTVADLKGLTPEKQFALMGEGMRKIALQSTKTGVAQDLLGRSGTALIKMMELGTAGLKKMADEAQRYGGVIESGTVAAAEKLNDQMTRLKTSLGGVGRSVLDNWLGPLEKVLRVTTELILMSKEIVEFELWLGKKAVILGYYGPGGLKDGSAGAAAAAVSADKAAQIAGRAAFEAMKERSRSFAYRPLDRIPGREDTNLLTTNRDAASGYRPLTKLGAGPRGVERAGRESTGGVFGRVLMQIGTAMNALTNAAAIGRKDNVMGQRYAGLAEKGTAAGFRAAQQRNEPMAKLNDTNRKQLLELENHSTIFYNFGVELGKAIATPVRIGPG